nr:MAG TPA: hypothetical protein [Caudoviricetes sp.]
METRPSHFTYVREIIGNRLALAAPYYTRLYLGI